MIMEVIMKYNMNEKTKYMTEETKKCFEWLCNEIDKPMYTHPRIYCTVDGIDNCNDCSLSNYGRDCKNSPIEETKE